MSTPVLSRRTVLRVAASISTVVAAWSGQLEPAAAAAAAPVAAGRRSVPVGLL
ncbi:hypothetical protein GRS96_05095 [Rathayibacter sp. VKM Ac-2803]|uniref:hypothetical protein n=1 Tax=unclassified Rathayibacter TaxID=2609250 RepID=UPI00135AB0D8|nr:MULTISPECIES: hypothetical protein [unclassified Rathayibacter]MWV48655.1 hypothetical protein [Rathayibacter sp. VKM Ac-2803]MWV60684.1 hypothetical protein [Rathayibacter sp. VKM Ac-2754]